MATFTKNYNLKKPAYNDFGDVADFNTNMDTIDDELSKRATLVDGKVPSEQLPEVQGLKLGETSTTAYYGDRGKTAYDHSRVAKGNPHNTKAADIVYSESTDVKTAIDTLKDELKALDTTVEDYDAEIEGMVSRTTTFNSDGSITETYGNRKRVTTFDSDTQITEKLYEDEALTKTKVTTFNGDTISEVVS